MEPEFATTLRSYFGEALRLLGPMEVGLALAAFLAVVTAITWTVAKVIDRKESHLGAALSAGLTLVLVGAVLGATFLALQLKDLCNSGAATSSGGFMASTAICCALTFAMIHGAFGTAWWRTPIMLIVVSGAGIGAGWISHKLVLDGRATQLPTLAAQTAGLKTDSPSLITTEELKKIAASYSARVEREELTRRQENLVKTYHVLVEKRARLNAKDAAAVAAFSEVVAAYTAEKRSIEKRQAELAALEKATVSVAAQSK